MQAFQGLAQKQLTFTGLEGVVYHVISAFGQQRQEEWRKLEASLSTQQVPVQPGPCQDPVSKQEFCIFSSKGAKLSVGRK